MTRKCIMCAEQAYGRRKTCSKKCFDLWRVENGIYTISIRKRKTIRDILEPRIEPEPNTGCWIYNGAWCRDGDIETKYGRHGF